MPIKKERKEGALARSQVMAIAERAVDEDAVKAIIICKDSDGNIWCEVTENFEVEEIMFAIRQTEFRFLMGSIVENDDDLIDED